MSGEEFSKGAEKSDLLALFSLNGGFMFVYSDEKPASSFTIYTRLLSYLRMGSSSRRNIKIHYYGSLIKGSF